MRCVWCSLFDPVSLFLNSDFALTGDSAMSLKSLAVAGIVGGVALGAIVGAAVIRVPDSGKQTAARSISVSPRAIGPQPPFVNGKPGPIIWDTEQLSTAPLDVQRAWITPYTIRDGYTGRVVFSPSQRGGE